MNQFLNLNGKATLICKHLAIYKKRTLQYNFIILIRTLNGTIQIY